MQHYYVYNRNEQLQECIAQYLKMVESQIKVVAIGDTEGQERLRSFLGTSKPHIFVLPLVVTVQDDKRNVLSTQHMYNWISETCERAEATIGADKCNHVKEQVVKATIHPAVLKILRKTEQPPVAAVHPEPATRHMPSLTRVDHQQHVPVADEQGVHWGDHALVSATATKDSNSRVSISDAMQNGKQREVGISPVAQATRR